MHYVEQAEQALESTSMVAWPTWFRKLCGPAVRERDQYAISSKVWERFEVLDRAHFKKFAGDTNAREAFQLIHAALLYHLTGSFGHELWRLSVEDQLVLTGDRPPFGLLGRPSGATIGRMHLASAAVRLPVMIEKVITLHPRGAAVFGPLWDVTKGQWQHRDSMVALFDDIRSLGHCEEKSLGDDISERLGAAVVIVHLIRDDFGHGELGTGGPYRTARGQVLDTVHLCRVVESQRVLIEWALEELELFVAVV